MKNHRIFIVELQTILCGEWTNIIYQKALLIGGSKQIVWRLLKEQKKFWIQMVLIVVTKSGMAIMIPYLFTFTENPIKQRNNIFLILYVADF